RDMWRTCRVPEAMSRAFSYASSSSPPNASRSLARRSRARLSSESLLTPFRASNAIQRPSHKLGLEPRLIEVKGEEGYGRAFGAMDHVPGQPIILPAGPMFFRDREAIAQALLERRIPSIAAFRENLEAGALISYGFDLMGLFYDIASYVHRIAGGAK